MAGKWRGDDNQPTASRHRLFADPKPSDTLTGVYPAGRASRPSGNRAAAGRMFCHTACLRSPGRSRGRRRCLLPASSPAAAGLWVVAGQMSLPGI